jgi:uncharacterized protein DUF2461
MAGIPPEAFEFFARVAADTSLETVEANRGLWQRAVHEPVEALCAELADEFGPAKVYNLHRSPDLWTHQYAYVTACDTIVYGLSLSLDGLAVEGGTLRMNSVQISRYRDAVSGPAGVALAGFVDSLTTNEYELLGERLKRTPDHPRGELLRQKSLLASRLLGRGRWLETGEVLERVRAEWRLLRPLVGWLADHVRSRNE